MLGRALTLACVLCGRRGIFRRWLHLVDRCPRCGHAFGREEGYWVGALIFNTAATQLAFFAVFLGGLWVAWPTVPWQGLLVGSLATIVVFPLLFYPWAKTLWLWVDHVLHPHGQG
jgi:uncharacterized protein (DUF983 family)